MRGIKIGLLGCLLILLFVSCGSQKGSIGSFKITVVPSEPFIDVDVLVRQNVNDQCVGVIEPYLTNFDIEVSPIAQGESPQTEDFVIVIDEVRIDYFPKYGRDGNGNSITPPPLASVSYKMGISLGATVTSAEVPVEIASHIQLSTPPLSALSTNNHIYIYDVRVAFIFKSQYTGEKSEVETYLSVTFADFADECVPTPAP